MGRSVARIVPGQARAPGQAKIDDGEIRAWLAEHHVRRIRLGGFDIDGILRGKIVSTAKFLSVLEDGFGFCDVIFGWDSADTLIDGLEFTGWHTGYPDTLARIDLDTRRLLPWDEGTAFFLADFWDPKTGEPLSVCPRQVLKRVLGLLHKEGATAKVGFEYEFFVFRETPQSLRAKGFRNLETLSPGMFGYSLLRAGEHAEFVNRLFDELAGAGIELEGLHTETGPGVYEAAIRYDDALAAADKAALFKACVKELARRQGLTACFMAKWNPELPGCSGHIHLSVWDAAVRRNRFRQGADGSADLDRFVGGMVAGMRDYLALVAPTVNSYKRLVENTWAPTAATWGEENRTTAVRLIPSATASSRLEFRLPGADANPYLALAAAVAMGIEGWRERLEPPAPTRGSAYGSSAVLEFPRSLAAAAEQLRASESACAMLGDAFVDHFAATRLWECRQYARSVTDWELARYFESA